MAANTEHLFNNFAHSRIVNSITDSDTSLTLMEGGVLSFLPGYASTKEFYCTLVDANANREIIKVTAISGDVFTIERGQDSSTARAWPPGSLITQRLVAANLDRFIQKESLRCVCFNPNGVVTADYPGEEIVQAGIQSCQSRWWKNTSGTKWRLIAGTMCSTFTYDDWPDVGDPPDWWDTDDGWITWPETEALWPDYWGTYPPTWWPSGGEETLDDDGYVVTPTCTWVQHFDDSDWEDGDGTMTWNTDHWEGVPSEGNCALGVIGSWATAYKPLHARVTYTGTVTAILFVNAENNCNMGENSAPSSPALVTVDFGSCAYDIGFLFFSSAGDITITNIEFCE